MGRGKDLKPRKRKVIHGHTISKNGRSKTYISWAGMFRRCYDEKTKKFLRSYRDKGIIVCERWFKFSNFLSDMGERPQGMTLDRINNSGHYEKNNCRWATPRQQTANSRVAKKIKCNGMELSVSDWARYLGLNRSTLQNRLNKNKGNLEEIVNKGKEYAN
jgi:hypothetical protein